MSNQVRKLITNRAEWNEHVLTLDRMMDVHLYHSGEPYRFPCFISSMLMEEPLSTPWWDNVIVTIDDVHKKSTVLAYMSTEEINSLKQAACDAVTKTLGEPAASETGPSSCGMDEKEWNAWWNRLDELKGRQSSPESTAPAPHAYPANTRVEKEPIAVKFIEEEITDVEKEKTIGQEKEGGLARE